VECGSDRSRFATVKRSFRSVPVRKPGAPLPRTKAAAWLPHSIPCKPPRPGQAGNTTPGSSPPIAEASRKKSNSLDNLLAERDIRLILRCHRCQPTWSSDPRALSHRKDSVRKRSLRAHGGTQEWPGTSPTEHPGLLDDLRKPSSLPHCRRICPVQCRALPRLLLPNLLRSP
jgi:hypothetical protein